LKAFSVGLEKWGENYGSSSVKCLAGWIKLKPITYFILMFTTIILIVMVSTLPMVSIALTNAGYSQDQFVITVSMILIALLTIEFGLSRGK